ncbi:MAG: DUF2079 domain-containing protein [Archangium sp.]
MTARTRIAQGLLLLAAITLVAWLVGVWAGGIDLIQRPGLQIVLGHGTNVRLAAWLALAAFLISPNRLAWLEFVEQRLSGRARWVIPLVFTAWLVVWKIAQHYAFETTSFDLSIFHYAVRYAWAEGPGFVWSFGLGRSLFSEHFEPIVLAAVPLDVVTRSPFSLLLPEAIVCGIGLWLAVGCAKAFGLRPALAWLIGAMYATNLTWWDAFRYDFHPESMLPAGVFATLWALKARRHALLALSVLFTLCLKEDMAIVLVPVVALGWWDDRKNWKAPLAVAVVSAAWCIISLKFVIPAARGPGEGWSLFAGRYAAWGATPQEAIVSMITRPWDLLPVIFGAPVAGLMAQLGFAALLDPLGLFVSLPALLEQRLTTYETQTSLQLYYGIGPLTVWMVAVIRSVRRVDLRFGAIAAVVIATLPLTIKPLPLPLPQPTASHFASRALLAEAIPEKAVVTAQTIIVPHLPIVPSTNLFPHAIEASEYVALMPDENPWPLEVPDYDATIEKLLTSGEFGVLANNGKLVILKRGAPLGDADGVRALLRR